MSGWDGSRPTWDPERLRSDGDPEQAAGTPPEEFERGYGTGAHAAQPNGQPGYPPEDYPPRGWADRGGYDRDASGLGQPRNGQGGNGPRGRAGAAQEEYPRQDYGQPRHGQPRHGRPDPAQQGYGGRDYVGHDNVDPEYAARMDPALQDFFSPSRQRPGYGQPGPQGQPGQPGPQWNGPPMRPTSPNRPQRPSGPMPQAGRAPWAPEPGQPPMPGGPDRWDGTGPRPGPRTAHRQDRRPPSRGFPKALVAVGVVVVLGIAAAAYLLLFRHHGTPSASNTPAASAPPHTGAPKQSASTQPSGQAAGYVLSAPATAGGYTKLATPPAAVKSVATAVAQGAAQHATSVGSKVTGQVSGYYQLSGGQVMSFAGYQGTFDPAKVLAGSGGQAYPAGPHGGSMACDSTTQTGTLCVWVTPTTMGVTEFFSSSGAPEVVTNQAKAAADTVNLRGGVEAAKS